MKLHYETITDDLKQILFHLMSLESLQDFYLVGGTGLSLMRGHRMSCDIDMFTSKPYGSIDMASIKKDLVAAYPYADKIEELDNTQMIYSLYLGQNEEHSVKVDLCYDGDPCIFNLNVVDGIRIADERDIAAMKVNAILGDPQRMKDFWDIHDLLESYSVDDILQFARNKYPWTLDDNSLIDAFERMPSCTEIEIISLKEKYWPLIVEDIQESLSKSRFYSKM